MPDAVLLAESAFVPDLPGTAPASSRPDGPALLGQEAELLAFLRLRFVVIERAASGHSHTHTVSVAAGPSIRELTDMWSRRRGIGIREGRRVLVRLVEAGHVTRVRAGQGKGRQKVALRLADNARRRGVEP
jgi:hypothetical protein